VKYYDIETALEYVRALYAACLVQMRGFVGFRMLLGPSEILQDLARDCLPFLTEKADLLAILLFEAKIHCCWRSNASHWFGL